MLFYEVEESQRLWSSKGNERRHEAQRGGEGVEASGRQHPGPSSYI